MCVYSKRKEGGVVFVGVYVSRGMKELTMMTVKEPRAVSLKKGGVAQPIKSE